MSCGLLGFALLLPGGDLSPARVLRDARTAVVGRPAEARAAVARLEALERAVTDNWGRRPDGPREELAALALAHAAVAEVRLRPFVGEDLLADLRVLRARCHAEAAVASGGPMQTEPFLRALAEHRPCVFRGVAPARGTVTAILYAVWLPEPPTTFDPAEPYASAAGSSHFHADGRVSIRLSTDLCRATQEGRIFTLLFEAFNAQDKAVLNRVDDATAAGKLTREEYVQAVVAQEQLAFAQALWVIRRNFRELAAIGLADDPADWNWERFRTFDASPAGFRHRFDEGYPHGVYGRLYDISRYNVVNRSGRTPASGAAGDARPLIRPAPGPDVWECLVLLDRLRFFSAVGETSGWSAAEADAALSERLAGDPWFRLHHALPMPARRWLASVRGGASVARLVEGAAAAAAAL